MDWASGCRHDKKFYIFVSDANIQKRLHPNTSNKKAEKKIYHKENF